MFQQNFGIDVLAVRLGVVGGTEPTHVERLLVVVMMGVDTPGIAADPARLTNQIAPLEGLMYELMGLLLGGHHECGVHRSPGNGVSSTVVEFSSPTIASSAPELSQTCGCAAA